MTAFDDAATRSNCAPHSRPNPLHSCCAGDILQCDVPLWPPGQIPPGASRVPRWTGNNPPSPPAPGRDHGSGSPPTSPGRLVDADGFSIPPVSSPLPPPADLYCHRAHRSCTTLYHQATGSRPRRVARAAGDGDPGRYTQAARPPYPASTCSKARPTSTARPRLQVDDETKTVVPSRRHPQSTDAAARHRVSQASPGPTGDVCDRPGTLWARPLCPGALYPSSILLADTAGCRPECAPFWRHIPSRWPLGSYRLCPGGHTTALPLPPTPDRTWQTQKDRTLTPHRLVPSAS